MVVKSIKNIAQKIVGNQQKYYGTLCTPAKIEYAISVVGIASLAISCLTNGSGSKLNDTCMDVIPYLVVSASFVFILNALCKGGASIISWIMVLYPLCALLISVFNKAPAVETEGFKASDALKEFRDAMDEASEKFDSENQDDDDDDDDYDDDEDFDDNDDEMFSLADMEMYDDVEPSENYGDRDQDDMPQIPRKKNEYKAEKTAEPFGVLDDLADVLEQKKNEAYKAMQKIKDTITGKKEEPEQFGVLDDIADAIEKKKKEAYGTMEAIGKLLRGDEEFDTIKPASYYRY